MHCRRDGRMQAGDREGRFGPTDQRQRTLQTVAVTIRGKVDTAETGDGGDFKHSTVTLAPLDKIDPPFP